MKWAYGYILAATLAATEPAQAACIADGLDPVSYKITIDGGEWKRNETLSIMALTERSRRENAEFRNKFPEAKEFNAFRQSLTDGTWVDLGAAIGDPNLQSTLTLMQIKGTAGETCFAIKKLTATFGYKNAELAIAKEVTADSCVYKEAVAHEMRHVALNQALLYDFYPRLKEQLSGAVQTNRVFAAPDMKAAQAKALPWLENEIQKILNEFVLIQARQSVEKVDTLEEYARYGAACDGRAREIAKRVTAAQQHPRPGSP